MQLIKRGRESQVVQIVARIRWRNKAKKKERHQRQKADNRSKLGFYQVLVRNSLLSQATEIYRGVNFLFKRCASVYMRGIFKQDHNLSIEKKRRRWMTRKERKKNCFVFLSVVGSNDGQTGGSAGPRDPMTKFLTLVRLPLFQQRLLDHRRLYHGKHSLDGEPIATNHQSINAF